jgi:hypothetical protein
MKKMLLMSALLISMAGLAQQPVITFNKTTHDFGKINESDGRVTTIFEFKNEGMSPLVLTNVRASCGCTSPKWTREPIEPGQSGQITVTYNPSGRPGRFQKTVTITSNAMEATTKLYIKGEVIPKPAQQADQYSIKMGELSLKRKNINFGSVRKGSPKQISIEYANTTQEPITVELLYNTDESYLKTWVSTPTLSPGQTGKIDLTLSTQECPIYGPMECKLYVKVNGKRILTDEYAITIKANIVEDFTKMTAEEIQLAPITEVASSLDLGVVQSGKKANSKIALGNVGVNPLHIRRVYSNDKGMTLLPPKSAIKGGKKGDIKLELNTQGMSIAQYSREVIIITNDPKRSVVKVKVNWTVE